jgi:adenylate cyclase
VRRAQIVRVFAIVLVWTIAGFLMAVYDDLVRQTLAVDAPGYAWSRAVALKTGGTAVGAAVAATLVVFVFKARLRGRPFAVTVLVQGLAFTVIAVAVSWVFGSLSGLAWTAGTAGAPVPTAAFFKATLFALTLGGLTSFALEVQDRIGRGAFLGFLLGRHHRARSERRCFMFLDLVGSTSIAERLGHVEYFKLLNAFFADVTDALLETGGEVYQYVGDEIIVSWPESMGVRNANCVRCFLLIREMVGSNEERYRSRFDLIPRFRAAFHVGEVTTGDVGVLKRDLVFTGETLNTAARIEERGKALGEDALMSGELAALLPSNGDFSLRRVEEVELRGTSTRTRIYAIDPA